MKKNVLPLNIGLSEEEKKDLEKMIGEFQQTRSQSESGPDLVELQKQVDALSKRLAYLTSMFLSIDRRMQPLYATVRLTYQKSEILNQRIHAIIDSLRSGEAL